MLGDNNTRMYCVAPQPNSYIIMTLGTLKVPKVLDVLSVLVYQDGPIHDKRGGIVPLPQQPPT